MYFHCSLLKNGEAWGPNIIHQTGKHLRVTKVHFVAWCT